MADGRRTRGRPKKRWKECVWRREGRSMRERELNEDHAFDRKE